MPDDISLIDKRCQPIEDNTVVTPTGRNGTGALMAGPHPDLLGPLYLLPYHAQLNDLLNPKVECLFHKNSILS
jgi:hypothetical protein